MSILRNSTYATAGAAAVGLTQWLMGVFIGRQFGTEGLGDYALATAIVIPIFTFGFSGLRPLYVSRKEGDPSFETVFLARALSLTAAFLCSLAIAAFYDSQREVVALIAVVACVKYVDGLSDIFYARNQKRQNFRPIMISMCGKSALAITSVAVVSVWAEEMASLPAAQIPALLAFLVLFDRAASGSRWRDVIAPRMKPALDLLWFAAPLAFSTTFIAINASLPRLFGSQAPHELGLFAGVVFLIQACSVAAVAFGQAISPRIATSYLDEDWRGVRRMVLLAFMFWSVVSVAAILLSIIAGPPILLLIYGEEFAIDRDALMIIVCGGVLSYATSLAGYFVTSLGIIRIQMPLFMVICAVSLAACFAVLHDNPSLTVRSIGWVYLFSNAVGFGMCVGCIYWLRSEIFRKP